MDELISIIILGGSLTGIGVIIVRKIPVLCEISEEECEESIFLSGIIDLFRKIRNKFTPLHFNIFLQKLLSRIKILVLAVERKTDIKLQALREEAKRKKEIISDNYWEELKKAKKSSLRKKKKKYF
ncbi:hypothetical protein J7K24_01360 [bacterium]|nr:hypothetical protein [bacterium]